MVFLRSSVPLRQTERAWRRSVIEYSARMGWVHWHDHALNVPSGCPNCRERIELPRTLDGWPDLWLVRAPRLIVVELKSERGRLTERQRTWLDLFRRCPGIEVYVWRPSNWPDVEVALH